MMMQAIHINNIYPADIKCHQYFDRIHNGIMQQ